MLVTEARLELTLSSFKLNCILIVDMTNTTKKLVKEYMAEVAEDLVYDKHILQKMTDFTRKMLNEEVRQNTGLNMMENRNISSVITATVQLNAMPPPDQTLCGNVLLLPLDMAGS